MVKTIKVCTGYKINGDITTNLSTVLNVLGEVEPIYKEFEGWNSDIKDSQCFDDLPNQAKTYLKFIEKKLNTPISIISIGPKRHQIINCNK